MKRLQIPFSILFVIIIICQNNAFCQSLFADTSLSPAIRNAINIYSTTLTEQLGLYNGKEYEEYITPFDEGHPYFNETGWTKGTVSFDGNVYTDVSIRYNLVTDEVIILNFNKVTKIRLLKEKVAGFSFGGHTFKNLPKDSLSPGMTAGFYEVLAKGKISLLARRTKNIQTYVWAKVELKVFKRDHFYLKKNNTFYSISSKKSLLVPFSDRKKDIQQFIKRSKIKYRDNPENAMIRIVNYYNQVI